MGQTAARVRYLARGGGMTAFFTRTLARDAAESLALGSAKVQAQLAGAVPRKVIVVPDRLVNIVT